MQAQALAKLLTMQAPVVSNMVSATHQINSYQMDQYKENEEQYLLDRLRFILHFNF